MNILLHDSGLVSGGSGGGESIGELTVKDLDFISNGKIVKCRSITAFTMWQDVTNGEWGKIQDFVGYFRAKGVIDFCFFGCWGNTLWNPLLQSNSFDALEQLDGMLNSVGGRSFLIVFTDQMPGSPVLLNKSERNTLLMNSLSVMRIRRTCRVEFVNEYGPDKNWPSPMPIPYSPDIFHGLVADWSTWFDGRDPQEPGTYISFANKHTGGFDDEWSRKSKVCVEGQRGQGGGLGPYPPVFKPVIVRERCRIAEGSLPYEHECSTALEESMGSGGNIHGGFDYNRGHDSLLQRCIIPDRQSAIDCINSAVSVYDKIPADLANHAEYRNSGGGIVEHDDNLMLRTYAMVSGNDAWVTRVQGRKPGMPITPINDWHVVNVFGLNGTVVHLQR